MMSDLHPLVDTWTRHSHINLYLLDAVQPEALSGVPVGMKGRSVGELFAHIHNVRLMWLELTPEISFGFERLPVKSKEDKEALSKDHLRTALEGSAMAIATLLMQSLESGKVKGYKPHPSAFFGYLLAHEWYHHGEICMTLTQAGHRLPEEVLYTIWEWDGF
jgi:uncharacterized damage-inducible protein DinB